MLRNHHRFILLIQMLTWIQLAKGADLLKECNAGNECPENASCQSRWCYGKICLCNEGYTPSHDEMSCVKGRNLKEDCSPDSRCSIPQSECLNGICQCHDGHITANASNIGLLVCVPNPLDDVKIAILGQKCDDVDSRCVGEYVTCVDGMCLCEDGYRSSTLEEMRLFPFVLHQCIPESFKPDRTVNITGECPKFGIPTSPATPFVTITPSSSSSVSTVAKSSSTTTSTTSTSKSTTTTATSTTRTTPSTTATSTTTTTTPATTTTTYTTTTTTPTTTTTTTTPTTTTPTTTTTTPRTTTITSTTTETTSTTTPFTTTITSTQTTNTPTTTTTRKQSTTTKTIPTSTSTLSSMSTTKFVSSTTTSSLRLSKSSTSQSTTTSKASETSSPPSTKSATISTPIASVKPSTSSEQSAEPVSTSAVAAINTTASSTQQISRATTTVHIGSKCGTCPLNANCEADSCGVYRCRCKLGYAQNPDKTECWKLSALGEDCTENKICQGPFTVCEGVCNCADEYETSDNGRWCRLKKSWFIEFPLHGEQCTGGFTSDCYMEYEQICIDGRCECKDGLRGVTDDDIGDRNAMYPGISQCRNSSLPLGYRPRDLCEGQSRETFSSDIYDRAKSKIHRMQGAIIGGSIGGVALIGIIVGVIALVRWKRRERQGTMRDSSSTASTEGRRSRYSFKIPRPFMNYGSQKEFDSNQISYPNTALENDAEVNSRSVHENNTINQEMIIT